MAKFIVRRLLLMIVTMLGASMLIFVVSEAAPGNVARNILGQFASPEQEASLRAQLGLDRPLPTRYLAWLVGSDWMASRRIGLPLTRLTDDRGYQQWWAVDTDGTLVQWKLDGVDLVQVRRGDDGGVSEKVDNARWQTSSEGETFFWGVNNKNRAVKWVLGGGQTVWQLTTSGWITQQGGPVEYIPLSKGFVRGDPGESVKTGRPVVTTLVSRVKNSLLLAAIAFAIVMPLALVLGLIAGLYEGRFIDRFLSLMGLVTTATPEFALGVILIVVFASWLRILPGATVFPSDNAAFTNPKMLVLPVMTLTLVELGYVLRMTRSSMIDVMNQPYIRTAILKGLPYRQIVFGHALRNALLAPITVIMLHVNWLVGGIVVVESIFGFPGLGRFIYEAAMAKDVFAIEAGAMIMVTVAVTTQLAADVIYTFLNPRIRYA